MAHICLLDAELKDVLPIVYRHLSFKDIFNVGATSRAGVTSIARYMKRPAKDTPSAIKAYCELVIRNRCERCFNMGEFAGYCGRCKECNECRRYKDVSIMRNLGGYYACCSCGYRCQKCGVLCPISTARTELTDNVYCNEVYCETCKLRM